jgi:hypothetical protein
VFGLTGSGVGNVTATVNGDNIQVTGDNLANSLIIYLDAEGSTIIQGDGNTTVNGQSGPVVLFARRGGTPGSLNVNLNGGNDQLTIVDAVIGDALFESLRVETGAGDDVFTLSNSRIAHDVNVSNSSGNDRRRVINSTIGDDLIVTGAGEVVVQNVEIGEDLDVRTGGAAETVLIDNVNVQKTTRIETQGQNDSVIVRQSLFGDRFRASTGNGNDFFALVANTFQDKVEIELNGGQDTLGVVSSNTFNSTAKFRGGSNSDTLGDDGSNSYSSPADTGSFETEDDSEILDMIDTVLSSLDGLLVAP